jgi:hypothetical protein
VDSYLAGFSGFKVAQARDDLAEKFSERALRATERSELILKLIENGEGSANDSPLENVPVI